MDPIISVITPARNIAYTLERVFKNLSNQTYKPKHYIKIISFKHYLNDKKYIN